MKQKMKIKSNKLIVECLLCNKDIYVEDNPKLGKFITCRNCESVFEIINIDPVMIDWPYYEDDYLDDEDLYDYNYD